MRAGAVVLAGGRSSRMGRDKALLTWGEMTTVEHAVAVVREGVGGGPVCVVRAPGQQLPPLDAIVVDDPVAYAGPLAALCTGLEALADGCDVAFACGVDTPLITADFVRAVLESLAPGDEGVVPVLEGRDQPLLGAYRVTLAARAREILSVGSAGMRDLLGDASRVRRLAASDLAGVAPDVARNANTAEEWAALRSSR